MARRSAASALAPSVRPDLSLTPYESDLSAEAIDSFAVAVGGRQALLDTLAIADGTPEIHQIVSLLIDPRYAGWNLHKICHAAGITVADLFVAYRKALIVQAHLRATKVVTEHLVDVVEDVMQRARPYEVTCDTCRGLGSYTPDPTKKTPNPEPIPCPTCRATGRILQLPDLDRQKVALELGQLIQQRGGIQIQQTNLTATPAPSASPGTLEQLQQAVHAVLYPRAETSVEAEIVTEAEPDPPSAAEGA